jgi:hypothetical protein
VNWNKLSYALTSLVFIDSYAQNSNFVKTLGEDIFFETNTKFDFCNGRLSMGFAFQKLFDNI